MTETGNHVVALHPRECNVMLVYEGIAVCVLRDVVRQVHLLTGRQPHVEIWGKFYELDKHGELVQVVNNDGDMTLPGFRVDDLTYHGVTTEITGADGYQHAVKFTVANGVVRRAMLNVAWV